MERTAQKQQKHSKTATSGPPLDPSAVYCDWFENGMHDIIRRDTFSSIPGTISTVPTARPQQRPQAQLSLSADDLTIELSYTLTFNVR